MTEPFIIYRPFKDLSTIECLLMSWIISLNDKKRTICFSNEYAGNMLNVSDRTIRTSIWFYQHFYHKGKTNYLLGKTT